MEVGHPHRHALSVSKFSLAPGSGMYDRTCWEGKGRAGQARAPSAPVFCAWGLIIALQGA